MQQPPEYPQQVPPQYMQQPSPPYGSSGPYPPELQPGEQPLYQHVPMYQSPMTPPEPTKKKLSTAKKVGIGCAALLGACVVCAGIGAVVNALGGGTNTAGTTTTSSAPTATTATTNPHAAVLAYAMLVQTDVTPLSKDFDAIGKDCGARDQAACQADLQKAHDDAAAFLSDLDAHPAPACLKTADAQIRSALQSYMTGAQTAIQGITDQNANEITQGSQQVQQGTTAMSNATSLVSTAQCG